MAGARRSGLGGARAGTRRAADRGRPRSPAPARRHDARVALTFDDGPHPEGTPAMLEALAAHGASATFFCVGEQAERYPALCEEILAARARDRPPRPAPPLPAAPDAGAGRRRPRSRRGHARAVDGRRARDLPPAVRDLQPRRPRAARRRGLRTLLWSRWGHDWRRWISPEAIAAEATENLGAGDVILLHDADHYNAAGSWKRTVAALPAICERIEARGLRTASI